MTCIRKIYNQSLENDILKMQNGTSMPNYKLLYTKIKSNEFLNTDQPWPITSSTVQCRANISQFTCSKTTVKLAALNNFYDNLVDPICTHCECGNVEDTYHVLFVCTKYNECRNNLISNFNDPNNAVSRFSRPSKETMQNIYVFLKTVMNYKSQS